MLSSRFTAWPQRPVLGPPWGIRGVEGSGAWRGLGRRGSLGDVTRGALGHLPDQTRQRRDQPLGQQPLASRRGVEAIGLEQLRLSHQRIQKAGNKGCSSVLGDS